MGTRSSRGHAVRDVGPHEDRPSAPRADPAEHVKTLNVLSSHGTHEYLFPSRPTARCPEPQRRYRWDFGKQFRALAKAAGGQNVRIHDLRHAGATILMTLGVPDPIVRKVTGHPSREPERYQHLTPELRADGEPDCDRAIPREASQEGTRKWHTYRHSARQACQRKNSTGANVLEPVKGSAL